MAIQNPMAPRSGNMSSRHGRSQEYIFDVAWAGIRTVGGCQTASMSQRRRRRQPRVSFDLTAPELPGPRHTISLRTRVSTLERRGTLTYLAPRFQNHDSLDLSFTALYDDMRDVNTFSPNARRDRCTLAKTVEALHAALPVQLPAGEHVRLEDQRESRASASQPVRVGQSCRVTTSRTARRSYRSRKGIYNTVDVGLASKVFGSQVSLAGGLARNATTIKLEKAAARASNTFGDIIPSIYGARTTDPAGGHSFSQSDFSAAAAVRTGGFPENQAPSRFNHWVSMAAQRCCSTARTSYAAARRQHRRECCFMTPATSTPALTDFISRAPANLQYSIIWCMRWGSASLPNADRTRTTWTGLQHQPASFFGCKGSIK